MRMLNIAKPGLLILGAGGYGKSLAELAALTQQWSDICFVDDQWPSLQAINAYPVISDIAHLKHRAIKNYAAIAAVGNNQLRQQWHAMLREMHIPLATIIHPQAVISASACIGEGVSIMAGCVLGTAVKIASGCILNSGVLLDHDVTIGAYAHLSMGVKISAGKEIAEFSFLEVGTILGHNPH